MNELARAWLDRGDREATAALAFANVARAALVIPLHAEVAQLLARAPSDEERHAVTCRALASAYAGAPLVAATPRPPTHPVWPGAAPVLAATLDLVGMCCVNETIATAVLGLCLEHATHAGARDTLRALFGDEIDHARIGWAHLASQEVSAETRRQVAVYAPRMIDAQVHGWELRLAQAIVEAPEYGFPEVRLVLARVHDAARELCRAGLRYVGAASS